MARLDFKEKSKVEVIGWHIELSAVRGTGSFGKVKEHVE